MDHGVADLGIEPRSRHHLAGGRLRLGTLCLLAGWRRIGRREQTRNQSQEQNQRKRANRHGVYSEETDRVSDGSRQTSRDCERAGQPGHKLSPETPE